MFEKRTAQDVVANGFVVRDEFGGSVGEVDQYVLVHVIACDFLYEERHEERVGCFCACSCETCCGSCHVSVFGKKFLRVILFAFDSSVFCFCNAHGGDGFVFSGKDVKVRVRVHFVGCLGHFVGISA